VLRPTALFFLIFAAASALAAEQASDADYSRDGLRKALSISMSDLPPKPTSRHFHFGYVEFHALGMDWRFTYLPIVGPLPGSTPLDARKMPTAFDLLRPTRSLSGPPMLDDERSFAARREFRRVQKMTGRTKLEK
jgi:hypothetical protein